MKDLVQILKDRLSEIQKKSPSFSQRAYAKKLGVSSGTLSEIFAGKRKITPSLAEKIAQKLEFTPYERKSLGMSVDDEGERDLKTVAVDADTIMAISQWWHFAILNLVTLPECQTSAAWMAKRLGISKSEAEESLALLQRLELISKENGRWKRTSRRILINQQAAAHTIQDTFKQDAEMIKKTFDTVDSTLRCNASATFAVDASKISKLRGMVHGFLQNEFLVEADSKTPNEVYKILVHFFPLTK